MFDLWTEYHSGFVSDVRRIARSGSQDAINVYKLCHGFSTLRFLDAWVRKERIPEMVPECTAPASQAKQAAFCRCRGLELHEAGEESITIKLLGAEKYLGLGAVPQSFEGNVHQRGPSRYAEDKRRAKVRSGVPVGRLRA